MDFSEYIFIAPPLKKDEQEIPQEISTLNGYEGKPVKKQKLRKRQLWFNILFISLLSFAAGWFGILLKSLTGQTNLALSVFLVIPPTGVLILTLTKKRYDINLGLRPNFYKNGCSYTLSFLLIPGLVTVTLAIGKLGGWISFDGLVNQGIGSMVSAVVLFFFSDFIKNCLEEFTWRGFFTQHFYSLGIPDLLNHFLTGIVWIVWHIPYWFFLLDKASIAAFSTLNTGTFVLVGSLFLLALSFVFGEIRLLTNSTWPAVILHTSLNAITITLLLKGFVIVKTSAEIWLSPGGNSIIFILLLIIVGIVLNRLRSLKPN